MKTHTLFAATAALTALALAQTTEATSYVGGGSLIGDATSDGNFNTIPTATRFDLFVPDHGAITDFQSVNLDVLHTWVGDLEITLTHADSATTVTLVDRPGVPESAFGNGDDLNGLYSFQDGFAPLPDASGAGIIAEGVYGLEPGNSLDSFLGLDMHGTWTLEITDNALGDTGELFGWEIIMSSVPAPGALALLGLAGIVTARRRRH
jgi:MYXO-CTERM domain-containing protein